MRRRRLAPAALLLPLALLLTACAGNSAAGPSGGRVDGKGSVTLNVGELVSLPIRTEESAVIGRRVTVSATPVART
ncbi:hypothetical protein AB0D62_18490 [Streptomyces massasporeus]|uniref:hypothetical protein n=1 Tax=Streptomyces massasporeus TaxID=67324 RepID=UPI0033CB2216